MNAQQMAQTFRVAIQNLQALAPGIHVKEPACIAVLAQPPIALGRAVSAKEEAELNMEATVCYDALQQFHTFKQLIEQRTLALQTANPAPPQEVKEVVDAADVSFRRGIDFFNALMATPQCDLKHVRLTQDIIQDATIVATKPESKIYRDNLKAKIEKLNSELETNPYLHAFWAVGRAFIGAIGCLLGVATIAAGLFSGVGLLLTLGVGLFSWGKHWGPVTIGKQLCVGGANLMFGGPTSEQREKANDLVSPLTQMVEASAAAEQKMGPGPRN